LTADSIDVMRDPLSSGAENSAVDDIHLWLGELGKDRGASGSGDGKGPGVIFKMAWQQNQHLLVIEVRGLVERRLSMKSS